MIATIIVTSKCMTRWFLRISARITEVYVDSSCQYHTKLTVKVMNTGYSASEYRARITDCPIELPAEWSYIDGDLVNIPPFHQHHYELDMKGKMALERFHCSGILRYFFRRDSIPKRIIQFFR